MKTNVIVRGMPGGGVIPGIVQSVVTESAVVLTPILTGDFFIAY